MSSPIDPKELKTLSDILALVLEEQSGESAAALEALRRRARHDHVTGGALKNLFREVSTATHHLPRPASHAREGPHGQPAAHPHSAHTVEQLRNTLRDLQQRFVEVRFQLDREKRESSRLRDRLYDLEHAVPTPDTARLRARVGDLEAQLRQVEALEQRLAQTQAELQAARETIASPAPNKTAEAAAGAAADGAGPAKPSGPAARKRRRRAGQRRRPAWSGQAWPRQGWRLLRQLDLRGAIVMAIALLPATDQIRFAPEIPMASLPARCLPAALVPTPPPPASPPAARGKAP